MGRTLMTGKTRTALVAGAGGVIGKALMEELAKALGWRARALSRRSVGLVEPRT